MIPAVKYWKGYDTEMDTWTIYSVLYRLYIFIQALNKLYLIDNNVIHFCRYIYISAHEHMLMYVLIEQVCVDFFPHR